MSDQPSYYAIITAAVRYDNRLTDSEKLLYAEITALSNKFGYCTASNNYFARLYDVTKRTISARVNNLKEQGYLTIEFKYKGNEVKQRRMYPMTQSSIPVENKFHRGIEKDFLPPMEANFQENNTSINNTRDNTINRIDTMSGNPTAPYQQVIDYLNKRTGKQYKHTTKKTQSLIRARIKEGFSLDDFKQVIDNMSDQWLEDKKMNQYLRPETLFGTKFEGYLNQQQPNAVDEEWKKQYEGVF
ncbi:alpha/beta hydrolase [Staphylococcus sp. HMSC056G08]|nr:alpha/beta hydrolase [Staphylococcus sp. HMSC056G08]